MNAQYAMMNYMKKKTLLYCLYVNIYFIQIAFRSGCKSGLSVLTAMLMWDNKLNKF